MPLLKWDDTGAHVYELGLDRGVLYVNGQPGVPWNGLVSVGEKTSGGTSTAYYMDGDKFLNVSSPEEFAGTITAFTYPDEFMVCDGTLAIDNGLFARNQPRQPFSMAYRTKIGNDVKGDDLGYKIHLIYNALAGPSERDNATASDTPAPLNFSWDITAQPQAVPGFKPTAHVIIDTTIAHPGSVSDAENILYGTPSSEARMPTIAELVEIFEENATLRITDNGDGTWTGTTADDDDTIITVTDETHFSITWDSAVFLNDTTYTLSSL